MKWNRINSFGVLLMVGLVCVATQAAVLDESNLPDGSNWYLHVNLELIKTSEAGRQLMLETVDEAMEDIEDELGVDFSELIEGVTLFGASIPDHGGSAKDGALVLHGSITEADQHKILAKIESEGVELTTAYQGDLAYYTLHSDEQMNFNHWGSSEELYFSFGDNQTLVTHNPDLMQTFVASNGYLGGFENNDAGALVVMHADRALMQGGANTSINFNAGWDSSVLQNVDSIALVIAENQGGIHISAELVATSEEVAMSVRNIVEGLVALKALEGGDDAAGQILRAVRFENEGSVLRLDVPVAADQIGELKDL